jgi:hypothetical protein
MRRRDAAGKSRIWEAKHGNKKYNITLPPCTGRCCKGACKHIGQLFSIQVMFRQCKLYPGQRVHGQSTNHVFCKESRSEKKNQRTRKKKQERKLNEKFFHPVWQVKSDGLPSFSNSTVYTQHQHP